MSPKFYDQTIRFIVWGGMNVDFFVDKTGFTGEDLLSIEHPIFAQATNNFTSGEAEAIIDRTFGNVNAKELKYTRLRRNPRHKDRMIEPVAVIANDPERAAIWVSHKEFALVTLIVDWWVEPLAYQGGHNLYKDGANFGMANMLFYCLEGFWNRRFCRNFLMKFQRMIGYRASGEFAKCEGFVQTEVKKVDDDRKEILNYFWQPFLFFDKSHIDELPKRALDLALPGLIFLGHVWRGRFEGPWEVAHDQSSNMAKQRWLWDALSSTDMDDARFESPSGSQAFPMNVVRTRFAASVGEKQLQICDILAGLASVYAQTLCGFSEDSDFTDNLVEAGIEKLVVGGIWPSTDVTPEELGTKGWDGNIAIDWLGKQFRERHNS